MNNFPLPENEWFKERAPFQEPYAHSGSWAETIWVWDPN